MTEGAAFEHIFGQFFGAGHVQDKPENAATQKPNRPPNHRRSVLLRDAFGDEATPASLVLMPEEQRQILEWVKSLPEPPGPLYIDAIRLKK